MQYAIKKYQNQTRTHWKEESSSQAAHHWSQRTQNKEKLKRGWSKAQSQKIIAIVVGYVEEVSRLDLAAGGRGEVNAEKYSSLVR